MSIVPLSEKEARRKRKADLKSSFFSTISTTRYRLLDVIGEGAYGVVCSAFDQHTTNKVAVKRIRKALDTAPMSTRVLRELKLLRLLRHHPNIIQIRDILLPSDFDTFTDTFVVTELMPVDLSRTLRSVPLEQSHIKYIMFQILRAVHYMHSASVFHRDLKPNNILINSQCEIRICDFGLARVAFEGGSETLFWTDYVATRWYRAPELIVEELTPYSTAIDMWSVGCIFAELLSGGHPIFPGRSAAAQLELVVDVLGGPDLESVHKMNNPRSKRMLGQFLGREPTRPISLIFRDADPLAVDVLQQILVFDPDKRLSALSALRHPYFAEYRHLGLGAQAKPLPPEEFRFEKGRTHMSLIREEFIKEIMHYHAGREGIVDSWGKGQFRVKSAVDQFAYQLGGHSRGQQMQSTTLQEGVLETISDESVRVGFMTMSEAELTNNNKL